MNILTYAFLKPCAQCILPKNRPCFRSRTNDYTTQCFTHRNAFLRLYANDFNCNKSRLGTCFSRLFPLITQQQYISPREVVWNHSPWQDLCSLANLVLKLSQEVCLGKGSGETLTTLRYCFNLFSAASSEVYNALLNLVRMGNLSAPF